MSPRKPTPSIVSFRGTFRLPPDEADALEIDATKLAMMLDGVDLAAERLPRYEPRAASR